MQPPITLSIFLILTLIAVAICGAIAWYLWVYACPPENEQNPKEENDVAPIQVISKSAPSPAYNRLILVIENYNNEAGFWWMIYNVLHASHVAAQFGMIFVVKLETGLYCDPAQPSSNWFEYYFDSVGLDDGMKQYLQSVPRSQWQSVNELQTLTKPQDIRRYCEHHLKRGTIFTFDRMAFGTRALQPIVNYLREWKRVMRVHKDIQDEIEQFRKQELQGYEVLIGVHYRGTDKFGNAAGNEDNPIHYEYEYCTKRIKQWIAQRNPSSYRILACSDEQPFIEHCISEFGKHVTYTSAYRSTYSTSGLHLNTAHCTDHDPKGDCKLLLDLRQQSIHRTKNLPVSKMQTGRDVLKDVLLLSEMNVFFRSRGSVSNFPKYLNPDLEEVDMNQGYVKSKD